MAFKFQSGMKMYEVIWERDGEVLFIANLHAANEAGATRQVSAFDPEQTSAACRHSLSTQASSLAQS
jgi:hypothetical protein